MLCDRIQDNLSAYIDGEVGPELTAEIDRHLRQCEQCQRLLDELRSVSAVLNSMPQHAAPSTLAEDLQIRLERQMLIESEGESSEMAPAADRRLAQRRPSAWPRVAAVAACLLLVAGITVLMKLPQRKEADPADTPGELESSRIAAVDKSYKSADSERPTRDKKAGSFSYEVEKTKSLFSTGDNGRKTLTERGNRSTREFGRRTATETGGGKMPSRKMNLLVDRGDNAPAFDIAAGGQFKLHGPGKVPASRLRKRRSPTAPMVAGYNNLFLVTTNGAAAEKELDIILEQAGIVEAKRWRETVESHGVELRYNYHSLTKQTPAAVEQLEVITVEANVNAEQFAALNYAVVNNESLVVQDSSNGVFAATAPTQRVMLQVSREKRYHELAGNRMIQDNLSQAAARRTRAGRFQMDLSDGLLQRQLETGATQDAKTESVPKAARSTEMPAQAEPGNTGRRMRGRWGRGREAEPERRDRPVKKKGDDQPTDQVVETSVDADREGDGRKSAAEGAEAAEPRSQPTAGEAAKEDVTGRATGPAIPHGPAGRPAEVVVAAESKPAQPPTRGEGKPAEAGEILAEKQSATHQAAAKTSEDDFAKRQVADAVRGLQTQQESDQALIPILIQVVARRALPPEVAAEESDAESAGKAKTGDVQLDVKPETMLRP